VPCVFATGAVARRSSGVGGYDEGETLQPVFVIGQHADRRRARVQGGRGGVCPFVGRPRPPQITRSTPWILTSKGLPLRRPVTTECRTGLSCGQATAGSPSSFAPFEQAGAPAGRDDPPQASARSPQRSRDVQDIPTVAYG
jgi:hypothetical protein